jgi:hypothetical protein
MQKSMQNSGICHLEHPPAGCAGSREVLGVVDFVLDCARTDNPQV